MQNPSGVRNAPRLASLSSQDGDTISVDMRFSKQLDLRLLGRISRLLPLAPAQTERRCATSFGCTSATASL